MVLWLDVLSIVVALGFAALGVWRGFRRAIMVSLAGMVLGVMMGTLWGDAWGQAVANRLGGAESTTQGVIRLGSLLFIVLFIGYGSGLFMPRRRLLFWQRILGGVVGLVNGLLIEAFSFQYIQEYFLENRADTLLTTALIPSLLTQWLPWILLALILLGSLTVIVIALVRFARYVTGMVQPAPEPVPEAPVPARPAAIGEPASRPAPEPVEEEAVEEVPTVPCPNCGTPVPEDASYCPNCGKIVA